MEGTDIVYKGQRGLVVGTENNGRIIHIEISNEIEDVEHFSVPIVEVRPYGVTLHCVESNDHLFSLSPSSPLGTVSFCLLISSSPTA